MAATSNPTTGHSCPLSPTAPAYPVGTLCSFTFTAPVGSSISGYLYQLNQSAPLTTNSTGSATITLTLPRIVNTLTVSALSPGGNVGSDVTVTVDTTALTPPANDGDLTGDATPDLIIPGNVSTASNTPPGLWLATGNTDGTVNPTAVNIGINGLGYSSPGRAADWNGTQAITGNYCGLGTQDVLAYVPGAYDRTSNPNGGGGAIVCGDTSGAPLHTLNPVSGNQYTIFANTFQDPGTQINATQIAGGGSENDVDLGGTYDLYYGTITTGNQHRPARRIRSNRRQPQLHRRRNRPEQPADPHRRHRLEPLDHHHHPTAHRHSHVPVEQHHRRPLPMDRRCP